jgi:uncharacterized protein (DUF3084 family)
MEQTEQQWMDLETTMAKLLSRHAKLKAQNQSLKAELAASHAQQAAYKDKIQGLINRIKTIEGAL